MFDTVHTVFVEKVVNSLFLELGPRKENVTLKKQELEDVEKDLKKILITFIKLEQD